MRRRVLVFALLLSTACDDGKKKKDPGDTDTSAPVVDACAAQGLPVRPFEAVEETTALHGKAADFTVTTRDGDWTLSEQWTGCDSILLVQESPAQASGWPTDLWERDVDALFEALPRNVQILFLSTRTSSDGITESLDAFQVLLDETFAGMSEEDRAWWQPRVHLVTQRAQVVPGWVGELMDEPGWGIGIDRFQRIRYIGSYADPSRYSNSYGWFEPNLSMVANEATYYNYEATREEALEAEDALVVPVFEGGYVAGNTYAEVTLPDAATQAGYDTLELDATMGCGGVGEYGYCPAWDYMAYLWVCDEADGANPYTSTSCQPAVAEVLGACAADGVPTGASCRAPEECGSEPGVSYTCDGYAAAIAADTLSGTCTTPLGEPRDALYTCNAEGTGYGDLGCACDTELGRWITTYHREGRWVHDVSPLMPLLARGGTRTFRFETSGPYTLDVSLRFSNRGKDARSQELTLLFQGCDLAGDCNATYTPQTVAIPADAARVQLATVITGHGMASPGNCAEFCDMDHRITVNGDDDGAVVLDFPDAGSELGCMEQVAEGTVPNQYGTWWYGRGGWCPGKHVPVVLTDITSRVTPGADNTFSYEVLYNGKDYTLSSGWAHTIVRAWLVVER